MHFAHGKLDASSVSNS